MRKVARTQVTQKPKNKQSVQSINKFCGTCGYRKSHLHAECPMCKLCTCEKTIMDCECREGE